MADAGGKLVFSAVGGVGCDIAAEAAAVVNNLPSHSCLSAPQQIGVRRAYQALNLRAGGGFGRDLTIEEGSAKAIVIFS